MLRTRENLIIFYLRVLCHNVHFLSLVLFLEKVNRQELKTQVRLRIILKTTNILAYNHKLNRWISRSSRKKECVKLFFIPMCCCKPHHGVLFEFKEVVRKRKPLTIKKLFALLANAEDCWVLIFLRHAVVFSPVDHYISTWPKLKHRHQMALFLN